MNRRHLLALVLVGSAIWVNASTLRSLWPTEPSAGADLGATAEDPLAFVAPMPMVETRPPFQPVLPSDGLPDPFLRSSSAAKSDTTDAKRELLPQVSMILRTKTSVRAVLDGRAVTVGDRIDLGTIASIAARSVTVRTRDGMELVLPLRTKATPSAPSDNPDARARGTAEDDPERNKD